MVDGDPRLIEPRELGISENNQTGQTQIEIPRDKRGRIRWSVLKSKPQNLISAIEAETQRVLHCGNSPIQKILAEEVGCSLRYPKSIKIGEDGLPRDSTGRFFWSLLKDDPERMMELAETEAKRLITDPQYVGNRRSKQKGLPGLLFAASNYYPGGVYALKEKVGVSLKEKPRGYWKDNPEGNIEKEAREFCEREGELNNTLLRKHKQFGLAKAIYDNYPGGLRALRKKLGLTDLRRPKGAWTSEQIEKEAQEFYNKEGVVNIKTLQKCGRGDLAHAIQTHYPGRINQLILNLGFEQYVRKPEGYWTEDEIETQAKEFYQHEGKLTCSILKAKDRYNLLGAIIEHYPGGIRKLQLNLGIGLARKEPSKWTPEDIEQQADEIFNRFHQLSVSFLKQHNMGALSSTITRYYPGGMKALKEKLGINTDDITHTKDTQPRKPLNYWLDPVTIEKEAQEFYAKEGELNVKVLYNRGRTDLATAIVRHYLGAFRQLRINLGLEAGRKPQGYWTPENIEKEALEFYRQEGYITQDLLQNRSRTDLSVAITKKYPGGWKQLRLKLGLGIRRKQVELNIEISADEANEQLLSLLGE